MPPMDSISHSADTADDIINAIREITADPYQTISQWKRANQKPVIGCMPMQIPEEMIHAFGALPVVVSEIHEKITLAPKHIQNFFCGYARSIIDAALKNRLDVLDGMVFQDTCHTMRPIFDIIHANRPRGFMKRLFLPVSLKTQQAKPFLMGELIRFRSALESFFHHAPTDADLKKSIDIYNQNRKAMRALYAIRRERPDLLTASETAMIVKAGMIMPKEDHTALIKHLMSSLAERTPPFADASARPGLLLTGSLCEAPPGRLLELVEAVGGKVVDDDLYVGSRYFLTPVPDALNPVEAIADAYLNMVSPCPTRIYPRMELGDYLVAKAAHVGARGIVVLIVKYCEAHNYTYPNMRKRFEAAGISHLKIETEHETVSLEQAKTRLQAFVEMLKD